MIERLRIRIRGALSRLHARPRARRAPPPGVRGCVRNVIVVHPSDKRFQEAVFILRDDYLLAPEADRHRLLREAREAAAAYTAALLPPRRRFPLWLLIPAALAAAALLLKLTGVY